MFRDGGNKFIYIMDEFHGIFNHQTVFRKIESNIEANEGMK